MARALLESLFTRKVMWGAKFALCQSFSAWRRWRPGANMAPQTFFARRQLGVTDHRQ
jgi:hypothetical protein